jgi:hypothetical protein
MKDLSNQEPVAWRVKWPAIGGGHKWIMVDRPLMEKEGFVNEPLYTTPPAQPAQREWIETACALIKAADDAAADRDYMLDSNDCIRVLRGEWKGEFLNDMPKQPASPAAQPAVPLTDEQIDAIRFSIPTKAVTQRDFEIARSIEAAHGITPPSALPNPPRSGCSR